MLSPLELQEVMQSGRPVRVVDVRSPGEFAAGHIPGASNVPLEQLAGRMEDLSGPHDVILLCQSGVRAAQGAKLLRSRGIVPRELTGGTVAWQAAGLPVVRTAASTWALERQIRFTAGMLVLLGVAGHGLLGWAAGIWFSGLIGLALSATALLGICPMGSLLAMMPWNRAR